MSDHGLTNAELDALPAESPLHFTNWPGRPSVPVTLIEPQNGLVKLPDGSELHTFADELSREPRGGLGE